MEIKINSDKLKELELSPSEFVVLKLLFQKEYQVLDDLVVGGCFDWTSNTTFLGILQHLELRGWLKITVFGDFRFEDVVLRQKALKVFDVDVDNEYMKLWTMFPFKVSDGNGGYRVLRAKSHDSDDFKKGLKLWNELIKKEESEVIIKCLNKQLELTRHKLQYTQQFLVWLRQKTYQKFKDLDDTAKQETTEII